MSRKPRAGKRGNDAEQEARRFLERQGLGLLDANWRGRQGELDLIMQDPRGVIVFVEVRFRGKGALVDGAGSINPAKRRRLVATAQAWLQRHGPDAPCRFDVVAIDGNGRHDWIANAFDAG